MKLLSNLLDRFINWIAPAIPNTYYLPNYAEMLADLEADLDVHEPDDDTIWQQMDKWSADQKAADDITALVAAVLRGHNVTDADMLAELIAEVLIQHYTFETGDNHASND